jgi:hypothetical protein
VLDQPPRGIAQQLAGGGAAPAGGAAEKSPHAFRRIGHDVREPGIERAAENGLRLIVGCHREQRIDAGVDRPLAQEIGAQRVDGGDARPLQLLQRGLQARALLRRGERRRPLRLHPLADAQLHLARGLLGERHRDDLRELGPPLLEKGEDARHQDGGLPGSGGRLDNEGGVEILAEAFADLGVGRRAHASSRNRVSSASSSFGFRAIRASWPSPHTGRKSQ